MKNPRHTKSQRNAIIHFTLLFISFTIHIQTTHLIPYIPAHKIHFYEARNSCRCCRYTQSLLHLQSHLSSFIDCNPIITIGILSEQNTCVCNCVCGKKKKKLWKKGGLQAYFKMKRKKELDRSITFQYTIMVRDCVCTCIN